MAASAKQTTDELILNVSSDVNVTLSPFDLQNYLWHPWSQLHSEATDYLDSVWVELLELCLRRCKSWTKLEGEKNITLTDTLLPEKSNLRIRPHKAKFLF